MAEFFNGLTPGQKGQLEAAFGSSLSNAVLLHDGAIKVLISVADADGIDGSRTESRILEVVGGTIVF